MSGCVSKKILVSDDLLFEQALIKSKSVRIQDANGKVVAYILATYINEVTNEIITDTNSERFFITIYQAQEASKIQDLHFTINGDSQNTHVQKLDPKDPLIAKFAKQNSWSDYFLVTSKKQNTRTILVEFLNKEHAKVGVNFSKNYF